jgi:hypothetical protein
MPYQPSVVAWEADHAPSLNLKTAYTSEIEIPAKFFDFQSIHDRPHQLRYVVGSVEGFAKAARAARRLRAACSRAF